MKQYDNAFLELLNDYAPEAEQISGNEAQKLYNLVAVKGKLKHRRFRANYKTLIIAAIVGTSLLVAAAAATYYSVGDMFSGVLKEQNPEGQTVPIASMVPVVEKSGRLVEETTVNQGLEATVRGVIGDANGFQILVDITDPTGKRLAIEQADGNLSQGFFRFGGIKIRSEETRDVQRGMPSTLDLYFGPGKINGYSGRDESVYIAPDGSKVTMLIAVTVDTTEPLVGKTLFLTLQDLKQWGILRGTEVGMGSDDLYDIVSQFDLPSDGDFIKAGASQDRETGVTTFTYELTVDTDKKIPLAPDLPGYFVTNAAVKDNVVYLRGSAPCPKEGERLFVNSQLLNPQTGEYMPFAQSGEDSDDSGESIWTLSFSGAKSLEELKGYVLVQGAGEGLHPLREGTWEFTVPLDFENTTRTLYPNRKFEVGGFSMTAKEFVISPYYMRLKATVDEATYEKMMYREHPIEVEDSPIVGGITAWDEAVENATINMKNGETINVPKGGGGGNAEDFAIGFDLRVVIDPEQIDSVTFGDLTVKLS